MFYSHEVLTSRKYGVATVWLVATLGSKSSLKRINRKQILEVDVEKACQTIVDPVAPMALRLQGNLLYGVSRVYLQQCGYVLSDAQNAHNNMVMMLRTVKNHALDPDAGKARPEQLVLEDDPSFLPDLALPPPELLTELDLDLNLDITRSGDSQSLTPFGSQQSYTSSHAGALGGLVLPTSSPDPPGSFRIQGDNEAGSPGNLAPVDDGFDYGDPGFSFDENGELFEASPTQNLAATPAARSGTAMHSDAAASAKVRKEHEEGRMGGAQLPGDGMDVDLPILGDDLPDGEAFPVGDKDQQFEVLHSTSTVSAPMQKKRRTARVLPIDTRMELRNKDLAEWNNNYLQNMDAVIKSKSNTRTAYQAKKDAEYFVWGRGLGGIAEHYAGVIGPNPFDIFIGDNLFELTTGLSRKKAAGRKHDRDSGIDDATQEESRRVRQKTSEPEEELGRGQDDEGFLLPGDDDVEMPREGGTALDDRQILSSMPWNISASKHGSSAIPRSGRPGSKPGSRFVSASPLNSRGQPLGLEVMKSLESDGDFGYGGGDFGGPGPSSPTAGFPSPTKPSMQVTGAMSAEGTNFLDFVSTSIVEKRNRAPAQAEGVAETELITFEELLPPFESNKRIACHGFMIVLTLGTKGILDVQQPVDFGDINIKLTQQAKASQIVEISDGEDSEDDEGSDGDVEMVDGEPGAGQNEKGQFEEQFAAGHSAQEEDDHDDLYDD
ncbi:Rec8 like protein-domain-containing protein [Ampelomyces quisqualis]|uniref:Rec8 like protein-domain-containing protein n=1 Tax=Ampelomyces quisqualis TaxID=50730 RepID=A0A6A5QQ77_AMPQU|nr:Rec8 like protein-domain-containing protein [Ampelomyces quisqualis]